MQQCVMVRPDKVCIGRDDRGTRAMTKAWGEEFDHGTLEMLTAEGVH